MAFKTPNIIAKKFFIFFSFSVLAQLAASCLQAQSTPSPTNSLITNSPFLPDGYGVKPQQPKPKPVPKPISGQLSRELEFRGIFQMGDAPPRFSIFDKKENKGHWVELNGSTDRFEVVSYQESDGSITVKSGSQQEQISMSKPSDNPLPIANAAPATPNLNNNANARINSNNNQVQRPRVVPRRRIIRRRNQQNNNNTTNTAPAQPPRAPNIAPPPPPPQNNT